MSQLTNLFSSHRQQLVFSQRVEEIGASLGENHSNSLLNCRGTFWSAVCLSVLFNSFLGTFLPGSSPKKNRIKNNVGNKRSQILPHLNKAVLKQTFFKVKFQSSETFLKILSWLFLSLAVLRWILQRSSLTDIFKKWFIFIMIPSENKFSILDHYNYIFKKSESNYFLNCCD